MNLSDLTVSVLIPAYNEEESIVGTVEAIRKHSAGLKALEIIVINGGSTDRTGICACFNPLNVFAPPALVLILLGFVKGAIDYTGLLDPHAAGHLGMLSVLLAMTGVQTLFIGLLADLIDRRMKM